MFYIELITENGILPVPICSITDFSLSITNALMEVTPNPNLGEASARWQDYIYGQSSYTISVNGLVKVPETVIKQFILGLQDGGQIGLVDGNLLGYNGVAISDWKNAGYYSLQNIFLNFKYINWVNASLVNPNIKYRGKVAVKDLSYTDNFNDVTKFTANMQGKGSLISSTIQPPKFASIPTMLHIPDVNNNLTWTDLGITAGLQRYMLSGTPNEGDIVSFYIKISGSSSIAAFSHTFTQGEGISDGLSDLANQLNNTHTSATGDEMFFGAAYAGQLSVGKRSNTNPIVFGAMASMSITIAPVVGAVTYSVKIVNMNTGIITYRTSSSNMFEVQLINANYQISASVTTNNYYQSDYSDSIIVNNI